MARRRVADALSEIESRIDQEGLPLLTEEEREQIRAKAREHVAKKRKETAEADYLAKSIVEEEREFIPNERFEEVTVQLAPFVASQKFNSAFISLDGKRYFHGLTYEVTFSVARTLEDVMARGWEHEREIHGERRKADENRRPILGQLSERNMGAINSTASLRRNANA